MFIDTFKINCCDGVSPKTIYLNREDIIGREIRFRRTTICLGLGGEKAEELNGKEKITSWYVVQETRKKKGERERDGRKIFPLLSLFAIVLLADLFVRQNRSATPPPRLWN